MTVHIIVKEVHLFMTCNVVVEEGLSKSSFSKFEMHGQKHGVFN